MTRSDAPPVHPSPAGAAHLEVRPIDRDAALDIYLSQNLPSPLAGALRASRAFRLITAATPGLAELVTIGELRRLIVDEGLQHVVYDAPATGHLLAMLDAPARFERAAAVGPVARRAQQFGTWVLDPAVTSVVAVTTGDALAVSELTELLTALQARLRHPPAMVIGNRLAPPAPSAAQLAALPGAPDVAPAISEAIRTLAARSRSERAQLGTLTRRLGRAPVSVHERPGDPVAAVLDTLVPPAAAHRNAA
jgi:hypothetical protein